MANIVKAIVDALQNPHDFAQQGRRDDASSCHGQAV